MSDRVQRPSGDVWIALIINEVYETYFLWSLDREAGAVCLLDGILPISRAR